MWDATAVTTTNVPSGRLAGARVPPAVAELALPALTVTLALQLLDRVRIDVIDDAVVSVTHQPADDVRPHPAQADHSELRHRLDPMGPEPVR